MGFKPIFEEERKLLNEKMGINLPTDCWRSGKKIYLDIKCDIPLYTFNVDYENINIAKDNSNKLKEYTQTKINELIKENKQKIDKLYQDSVENLYSFILTHKDYFYIINYSGGKDSDVQLYIWYKALERLELNNIDIYNNLDWCLNSANTSNDTADTYKQIKKVAYETCENKIGTIIDNGKFQKYVIGKMNILTPKLGWSRWLVEVKDYFIPSRLVRNCCSTYKEGQVNKAYDKNRKTINVLGVRSKESTKRKDYERIMDYDWRVNHFGTSNVSKEWINYAPIIDFSDEDVWMFILRENIEFNNMYRLGFNRIGCLICPYQSDYIDILIRKYYPQRWSWWEGILEKNYEKTYVKNRLKWTLEEWKHGKWKDGTSKEYALINKKPTEERVRQLSEIKGISLEMAEKFFNKTCQCGKKLNPTELAMFYKLYGRYENKEDDRTPICKKCLCEKNCMTAKEYSKMSIDFREDGCNLF